MKTQYITIVNCICYGVGMKLLLKYIFCCSVRAHGAINFLICGVLFKNWCSGKAEKLCFRKKSLYGIVVISELGTMAFIKNNCHSLIPEFL
ncbi:hypothetical protein D3C74_418650 [compost metagenome]